MIDPNTALEASAALVTAIGGVYTVGKHLIKSSKAKKEKYRAEILKQAKEEADRVKLALEAKIAKIEEDLKVQKDSMSKDFDHFKQIYNSEIKALGEKIENLREDLSQQHQALVGLLTKLVGSK